MERTSTLAGSVVKARIAADTKARATVALDAMGLTISDAIRLLLLRVAEEQRLPFEIHVPNDESRKAIKQLNDRKGKRAASAVELFEKLGI